MVVEPTPVPAVPGERRSRRPPLALLMVSALVAAAVTVPIIVTVVQAATGDWNQVGAALQGTDIGGLLLHTVLVTALVTPLCAFFGVAGAWLVERTDMPGRRAWAALLVAPIAIPLYVTSYSWAQFGTMFQGLAGAVSIVSVSYYPIVFLLSAAALRGMDPALEESAKALGCSSWRVFWRVVMPQLRPALLGGLLIVVLDTLVEFDAFVGIHYSIFITNIYDQYRISFSTSGAAALSCFSIGMCILVLCLEVALRRNRSYNPVRRGTRRPAMRYPLGKARFLAVGLVLLLAAAAVGVPLSLLFSWLSQATPRAVAAAPASWRDLAPAAAVTIGLGVVAAVLATAGAFPIAFLATRYRDWRSIVLDRVTYLSFALPDLVAAIALAFVAAHFVPWLYSSIALLLIAYVLLFLPVAVLGVRVSMDHIDWRLDDSARALGCTSLRSLARVHIPLLRPGLVAASVLVFTFVLSDLSTTQVLAPPGLQTLGTQFAADASAVAYGAASGYAAMLMVLAAGATYVLMSRFGRVRLSR